MQVRDAIGPITAELNSKLAALLPGQGRINGTEIQENTAALLRIAELNTYFDALADWLDYADFVAAYTGAALTSKVNTTLSTVISQAPAFA